jgi:hypothetical protein
VKRLAAGSVLFGALFLITGCTVSIAQQPPSDEAIPSTEPSSIAQQPTSDGTVSPTNPSSAPASPQNTALPTDAMTVERPAYECKGLAEKPCRNKKAESERASMAARKVAARRKAEAERKAAEQRKAKAAALRLTEERKAQEARLADAARLAKEAEEKRLADDFKRAFERGRSAWLNAQ